MRSARLRFTALLATLALASALPITPLLGRALRGSPALFIGRSHKLFLKFAKRSTHNAPRLTRRFRYRLASLDADSLFRSIFVDPHPRARRLAVLRIDQHHVGDVNRRLHYDDAALLLGRA